MRRSIRFKFLASDYWFWRALQRSQRKYHLSFSRHLSGMWITVYFHFVAYLKIVIILKNSAFLSREVLTKVSGDILPLRLWYTSKSHFYIIYPIHLLCIIWILYLDLKWLSLLFFYNLTWGWEYSSILEQNPSSSKKMGWGSKEEPVRGCFYD